jgi:hypothetical protein
MDSNDTNPIRTMQYVQRRSIIMADHHGPAVLYSKQYALHRCRPFFHLLEARHSVF